MNTEFGAKLHISMVDGYAKIERLSFDAFNEATDFFSAVEGYRQEHGLDVWADWFPQIRIKSDIKSDRSSHEETVVLLSKDRWFFCDGGRIGILLRNLHPNQAASFVRSFSPERKQNAKKVKTYAIIASFNRTINSTPTKSWMQGGNPMKLTLEEAQKRMDAQEISLANI